MKRPTGGNHLSGSKANEVISGSSVSAVGGSRGHRALPLQGLRDFEAAARLGSFVAAAEELGVTPGAVSHQVRALEARVGVRLFDRRPQSLLLTAAGRALLPALSDAFVAI